MLHPAPLSPGDTIGFFSPSSPATVYAPGRFARAKAFLQQKGFRLKAGQLTGQCDGYRSGSIQARAEEFNALARDPEVRCIISTIGGSNSNALLPYLDYDALRADPKIIVGYSDVTALLLGIQAQTGLVTFYGPALVASFGEMAPLVDETYASFEQILCQPPALPYDYPRLPYWTDERIDWEQQTRAKALYDNACDYLGSGLIRGRLIGGNLNTIGGIWGSPYMPSIEQGDLLFIEDSLKDIATVERSFAFLKLNGVFDRVKAVILGKHELFNDMATGRTPLDVLLEVLDGQALPIVNGFDCCHTHPMFTLPLGVEASIDFDLQRISLTQPYLISD
ncbi:S66 family peptidase [Ferrimonas marina]|uniref:Muramoyltetrapeptide carboxypeptidase LdcA (Peptidoglycan recycling) n=1 Tax=Ferrimonas marina TaxID=299255 RepID=A0A1M5N0D2_9GAMM|nr:S66 peptidase family protein [Ferrimonas marina]SHG82453.1 Muramoyltetrapeptide carboxypeptidase LdcA (peptidoglycan recycling) [Ferrimonas marina]